MSEKYYVLWNRTPILNWWRASFLWAPVYLGDKVLSCGKIFCCWLGKTVKYNVKFAFLSGKKSPSHRADNPFSAQKNDKVESSGGILEIQTVIKPVWNAVGEALSHSCCDVDLRVGDVASDWHGPICSAITVQPPLHPVLNCTLLRDQDGFQTTEMSGCAEHLQTREINLSN